MPLRVSLFPAEPVSVSRFLISAALQPVCFAAFQRMASNLRWTQVDYFVLAEPWMPADRFALVELWALADRFVPVEPWVRTDRFALVELWALADCFELVEL